MDPQEVEDIAIELNGFDVRKEFHIYWEDHPEIGLPVAPEDNSQTQEFDNAILSLRDGQVVATEKSDPATEGSVTQIPPY